MSGMLHVAQADGNAPGPYAMSLHRERMERRARLGIVAVRAIHPAVPWPTEILAYPAHVFADDCDRTSGECMTSPSRIREIQDLICRKLKVRRSDMLSIRRDREAVTARQIAMYLCKHHTPNSLPDLGRRFGGRDHTTVLHAVDRIEAMMSRPMGTGISVQWRPEGCDFIRNTVNAAETIISTWGTDRTARLRHPSRRP